jgi:hypothetical protein
MYMSDKRMKNKKEEQKPKIAQQRKKSVAFL